MIMEKLEERIVKKKQWHMERPRIENVFNVAATVGQTSRYINAFLWLTF